MIIFARINDSTLQDASTFNIGLRLHFNDGGTIQNISATVQIAPPTTISDLTLNSRVRTAISNYVDATFETTTSATDVLMVTGSVATPLL